jgi:hypothetical protein
MLRSTVVTALFALPLGAGCAHGMTVEDASVADASPDVPACPTGQERCGERCSNRGVDPQNCGACGHECSAGEVCSAGICGGPTLVALTINPDCPYRETLTHVISPIQLAATARFSDGSTRDVTTLATWRSSDESLVTISNASGAQGVAQPRSYVSGTAVITATLATQTVAVPMELGDQFVVGVALYPPTRTVAVGFTTELHALVEYASGQYTEQPMAVVWNTSDPDIALVDASGNVTGVAPGTVTITATSWCPAATATVTVTP